MQLFQDSIVNRHHWFTEILRIFKYFLADVFLNITLINDSFINVSIIFQVQFNQSKHLELWEDDYPPPH